MTLKLAPASPLLEKALAQPALLAQALFQRPESLSQFLPYEEYLPEYGLFRQKDGSLGCVYRVELIEHEAKTSEEIFSLLQKLKIWFSFSEQYAVSLLFEQNRLSPHDPYWQDMTTPTDLERANVELPAHLYLAQLQRWRAGDAPAQSAPLRRRLFLSVRALMPEGSAGAGGSRGQRRGWLKEFFRSELTLQHEVERFLKELRLFNYKLTQFEMSSPLSLERLDANALAGFLRETFNPVTAFKRPFAPVNLQQSLSQQLIFCPSTLDYPGISREGVMTRTISLKNAPSLAYPGAMAYFLSLQFPFKICLNLSFPSSSSVKNHFGVKDFFLQNTPTARSRRQKAEIEHLQEQLLRDDRVIQMTFFVLLEATSHEVLEQQTHECLVRFQRKLECEALVEPDIGLGLWLNALPLNYHPIADYTTQRSIRILASDLIYFCPVFDSFRGMPPEQAKSVFLSRENNLVPFSLKTFGNSHMTAVLGDTGSAKSGQVIKLLLGELRSEVKPLIFVIDYKTSYGMISNYLASELTTFDRGKPLPFSPFRGLLDEDKLRFLVQLLASAMQLTSVQFHLESEHRTCLSQALKNAYQTKAQISGIQYLAGNLVQTTAHTPFLVTLDDVIAALGALTSQLEFESYGPQIEEITKKLRPFYSDGIYASFFKSTQPSRCDVVTDLFVYDLDGLANDPILQALVTMSVIEEIRRKITAIDGQERGGFIVIEELGMLGRNNPAAKDFVIDAAETFRKLGFFLIGLTPNPRNYFELEAGQAMWAVADHYLFLAMKEDNVDFIAQHSNLLNEASVQIIKSLKTVRGQYADCFYLHKSKNHAGAFRSIPSAQEMWLMPTHLPDHLEAKKTLARFPGQPVAALEDLVKRYPQGTKDVPKEKAKEKKK